jgi:hypothetical protein
MLAVLLMPRELDAQTISFTNHPELMPNPLFMSGSAAGVADMNGDYLDDIIRGTDASISNDSFHICYQQAPNDTFTMRTFPTLAHWRWSMCAGDVNNDGLNDVLWCPTSNVYLNVATNSGQSYAEVDLRTLTFAPGIYSQGSNFANINNDNRLDVFVCNDVGRSHIYTQNSNGTWAYSPNAVPLATVPSSDNSGNYASIFSDLNNDGRTDLYISHCRQGITNSTDPRRINQLFLNNGNGTYTQDTTNASQLLDGSQTWSSAVGDINNDGAMDVFIMNYDVESKLMLNNGSGVFSDITNGSGISGSTTYFGINTSFHDFDNDGFTDLLIGGTFPTSGTAQRIYRNNGNNTFTYYSMFGTDTMPAYAVGDLNHDGFLDVLGVYADGMVNASQTNVADGIWINDGNSNHWIACSLQGTVSNRTAIGAIVKLYGPWGIQVREVRSGEGYGIQNTFNVHFGIGTAVAADSITITWPSGIHERWINPQTDTYLHFTEGSTLGIGIEPAAAVHVTVTVMPQPVNDAGQLLISGIAAGQLQHCDLYIYNAAGQRILAEQGLQQALVPLHTHLLAPGIYFYELRCDGQRLVAGSFTRD